MIRIFDTSANISIDEKEEAFRKLLERKGIKEVKKHDLETIIELVYWIKQHNYTYQNYKLEDKVAIETIIDSCYKAINKTISKYLKEQEEKEYISFYKFKNLALKESEKYKELIKILVLLNVLEPLEENKYRINLKGTKEIDNVIEVLDVSKQYRGYILYKQS